MGLTALLLRAGARRPHVLVVSAVGGTAVRYAVEAEMARRGWVVASAPADADILVVAGEAGPELAAVVDDLWRQVPAPRARATVVGADRVGNALEAAAALLADPAHQLPASGGGEGGEDHDGVDHDGDGHDEGEAGHGEHGGDMEMPGGLPMADLGDDRDGLKLDRLHVPLGPVLPDWPAGLVLGVTLQGDVIQEAEAAVLDGEQAAEPPPGGVAVRELDALARVLGVAGWPDAAARARRLRDALLAGASPAEVQEPAEALLRRVRRSRTLRWLVRGIPAGAVDVAALLDQRLDAVRAALMSTNVAPDRLGADELPNLLVGAELAAARLVVAALDPVVGAREVARHD